MNLELQDIIWDKKEAVTVSELWCYVCRYCYMPKLTNIEALYEGISKSVSAGYFGLADGKEDGRYTSFRMNESEISVSDMNILVRQDIAEGQIASERPKIVDNEPIDAAPITNPESQPDKPDDIRGCHIYGEPDVNSLVSDMKYLYENVLSVLKSEPGAKFTISIDVNMMASGSIDPGTIKNLRDNIMPAYPMT